VLRVMQANPILPAVTAQDAGRELIHQRLKVVQIMGDPDTLKKIAWIFQRVPDLFDLQCLDSSLVVRLPNWPRVSPSYTGAQRGEDR
jgi:hypothetical protein